MGTSIPVKAPTVQEVTSTEALQGGLNAKRPLEGEAKKGLNGLSLHMHKPAAQVQNKAPNRPKLRHHRACHKLAQRNNNKLPYRKVRLRCQVNATVKTGNLRTFIKPFL